MSDGEQSGQAILTSPLTGPVLSLTLRQWLLLTGLATWLGSLWHDLRICVRMSANVSARSFGHLVALLSPNPSCLQSQE